jgi:hypothetical protein
MIYAPSSRWVMGRKTVYAVNNYIPVTIRRSKEMTYELETSIGTFVIYNRQEARIPEVEILGDDATGTGFWHFGWKDGDQFRLGYESAEAAQDAMDAYVWAVNNDYGWKP